MNEQTKEQVKGDEAEPAKESAAGRQRSTIGFPYMALPDAEALAQAIHGQVGNGDCSTSQMAAWTNQSNKSSTFRIQVAAARMFGIIDSDGPENYRLSQLGRRIVDPNGARLARVEAFLNIPLFSALYENHKEGILPPAAALELEIAGLGVAPKQKDRARQVFERSAEHAAFFEHGKNRLVKPGIKNDGNPSSGKGVGGGGSGTGMVEGGQLNLDPLLMALLRKIPQTDEGWPNEKRLRWFRTFAMNVSQVYDDDVSPVELSIEIANRQTKSSVKDD